jgi:starvation-inducible DNA-binding protein
MDKKHDGRSFHSPSALPDDARYRVIAALEPAVREALALQLAAKVAHWNVRGPGFAALHPFFEQLSLLVQTHVDDMAERTITLGGLVQGGAKDVARAKFASGYPGDVTRDLEHVRLLAESLEGVLLEVRGARSTAAEAGDKDTEDLLTAVVTSLEKQGWQLRATLA